jgi:hypothetical protein
MRYFAKAAYKAHTLWCPLRCLFCENLVLEESEVMVMGKLHEESETGCCPRFNPAPWDGKEVTFKDKLFVKDHVRSFFHIPLNFAKVMVKNMEMI